MQEGRGAFIPDRPARSPRGIGGRHLDAQRARPRRRDDPRVARRPPRRRRALRARLRRVRNAV